jgi:nucleoside-diphosphate-sugar epimerase
MMSALSKVVVLGGGGFLGSRLIEKSLLAGTSDCVALLRSARSFARLSRLGAAALREDTGNVDALAVAIKGASSLVNLTLGESHRMVRETEVFYNACCLAKVPLFIHMSSAVVFDRLSDPSVVDDSRPIHDHWMLYARAKGECETFLKDAIARGGGPRVVVLRPGLIWGPRSPWSHLPARSLDRGQVWLAHGGRGVCNLIHVDNLARCVEQVAMSESRASGFYSVSDPGSVTWGEFFESVAVGLGYPRERVCRVPAGPLKWSRSTAVEWLKQRDGFYALTRWLIPRLAGETKSKLKALLPSLAGGSYAIPVPVDAPLIKTQPSFNREQWSLHSTERKLGMEGFFKDFGNPMLMPFEEGLRTTLNWLRFAGYGRGAA